MTALGDFETEEDSQVSKQRCMYSLVLLALVVFPCRAQNALVGDMPTKSSATTGTLEGLVLDVSNGQRLPRVDIEVVGQGVVGQTDIDGHFSVKLQPGTYQVRASRTGYQSQTIDVVEVTARNVSSVEFALSPQGQVLGEVVVTAATGIAASEIAMLAERKAATTINDALSAREIRADTSSNAAGVLQRMPGITVAQDKYVFVRGLNERYSNTVLNEATLPTTEPDRRVVPMDLIPTSLLDNVRVLKSFTPDQPGEFSGGLVKIQATEFPSIGTLKVSASYGFNSQTTFDDIQTYPGDRLDWLGFGTGRRRLPAILPSQSLTRFGPDELTRFGRAFENIWQPRRGNARPNQSYGIAGGTTIGRWGLVGALNYSNKLQNLDENRIFYVRVSDRLVPRSIFANHQFLSQRGLLDELSGLLPEEFLTPELLRGYQSSSNTVRLGGTGNVAYKFSNNHKLLLKNFYTHDGTDQARTYQGWYESRYAVIRNQRLRYQEETIYSGQLSGDHLLTRLGDSLVTWRLNYARATLDEPDLRETIYELDDPAGRFRFFSQLQSGLRLFNAMAENIREPAVDWSKFVFLGNGKLTLNLKAGAAYSNRDRSFNSRRIRLIATRLRGINLFLPPEQLLAPENIRPDGFLPFEETRPTDAYQGIHDILAGYAMADVAMRKWRFIGGLRAERSDQRVDTFDPFTPNRRPVTAGQKETDLMPSMAVVYGLTGQMNVRVSYSQTVARPQFRELSPFEFTDVTGGPSQRGNPQLQRSTIRNFDTRWEWFVSPQEVLAVSFFYKRLVNPIEQIIQPSNELTILSYRNVNAANNWGLEFEVRKKLGFLSPQLERVSVTSNYTFVESRVDIGEQGPLNVLTTLKRPLVGQSRHAFNSSVGYEIPRWRMEMRGLFNYIGRRITDVGGFGLPDIVEEGMPSLDFYVSKRFLAEVKNLELKFSAENLINRETRFNQGRQPYYYFRRGRTFSLGLSYTIF